MTGFGVGPKLSDSSRKVACLTCEGGAESLRASVPAVCLAPGDPEEGDLGLKRSKAVPRGYRDTWASYRGAGPRRWSAPLLSLSSISMSTLSHPKQGVKC